MTLQEAIKIEETPFPGYFMIPIEKRKAARELGIEALNKILELRGKEYFGYDTHLQGEDS